MLKIKKNKKILILIIIAIALFLLFLSIPKKVSPISKITLEETKIISKAILEINGIKYESGISNQSSIADFMDKLKNDGKIDFKEKNYTGMGKFIEEINGVKGTSGKYWIYYINNEKASIGASKYILKEGDIINWKQEGI